MRIRTGYSFKHAVGHVDEVADRIKELGWRAAPISDRLSTFGFVSWTKACEERDLRPVYGVELPVCLEPGARRTPTDWWSFFAVESLRPLNEAVERATGMGGLTYQEAQSWPGLIKLAGERCLMSNVTEEARDVYLSLSPATPRGLLRAWTGRRLPVCLTSDNCYTAPGDREFYRVAMGLRASVQSYPQHICGDDELRSLFDDDLLKRSLAARDKLLQRCQAKLGRATLLHPQTKVSLRTLCTRGATKLGVDLRNKTYRERLDRELRLIAEKQFEDYFHIISDLMQWARARMLVGPARGSSCGSLVCYLLGITSVDPIPYGLIFERFIDTTRADLPDIDLDFSADHRDLALEYVARKYGQEHTARLGSVVMWQARSSLNQIGVSLRIPKWQVNEVSNTVVKRNFGDARADSTVLDTLQGTEVGRRMLRDFPAAILADRMEDHPAAAGKHAAGMLITDHPVVEHVAVDGKTGVAMCDKYDAERLGLIKIDMLGLTQLSVLERCMELIGEDPTDNSFLEHIPLDDPEAFRVLNELRFSGVFQFQQAPLKALVNRLVRLERGRIDQLEDVIALGAIVRPGPMLSGSANSWVRRRAGNEPVTYPHPALEPYIRDTYGIIVYQEQIMHIGRELGDLSWEDVTALRKAMSKSLGKEYFDQFGDKWKAGASKRLKGMSKDALEMFWRDLCNFGSWAFNRSHSVAYGITTYWTLWFKAHHPVEFAAATLDYENPDKQVVTLREMRDEGIDYLPIDRERSTDRWTIKEEGGRKLLVGPLTNIRGVGPKVVRDIMDSRARGEELRPSLLKRLGAAQTQLDSLTPIADAVRRLHPDLPSIGVVTRPTPIAQAEPGATVLVIGRTTKIMPLDENEPGRVAKRDGKVYSGPTAALNLFLEDDTGEIFCKVNRYLFPEVGRQVVSQAKKGRSLFAVRGWVPPDFRMIRVDRIKYLGDM